MKKYNSQEIYIVCNIYFSESLKRFSKRRITNDLALLLGKEKNNYYYVLRENHNSILEIKQQGFIQEDEDLIFKYVHKKDRVELINMIDYCEYPTSYEKVFGKINKLDFKLWKSLPKCTSCKINNIKNNTLNNEDFCLFELKKNDIFRLGDIKFILREFHVISNTINNDCDNCNNYDKNDPKNERIFSILLKPYQDEICDICKKKELKDDPLLKFCDCEKYRHFKCMKKKIKEIIIKEDNNNGCIRYYIKTNCFYCKKFIPLSFFIKENGKYNLYELVDIPRDDSQEYLLLETIDFLNKHNDYIKFIYYVKLREKRKDKNIDTILISSNRKKVKGDYPYNKLIEIDHSSVSTQHALLDYDIEEKNLIIRNISDINNTLILQDKFVLEQNKNNKLLMELGNIQIESHLISDEDEYYEVKDKMDNSSGLMYTRYSDSDSDKEV